MDPKRRQPPWIPVTPDLTSAALPPIGPGDHVRGEGEELIVYLDLACPACAEAWSWISSLPVRLCARHFPIASKRPRAPALHAAAEAASIQDGAAFWGMVDSIYADHAHIDDPHLWRRAESLGLDLERFESDRRSGAVAERVRGAFEGGLRAGVTGTPTLFADREPCNIADVREREVLERWAANRAAERKI
jgi:protein-disulfide isomerase